MCLVAVSIRSEAFFVIPKLDKLHDWVSFVVYKYIGYTLQRYMMTLP